MSRMCATLARSRHGASSAGARRAGRARCEVATRIGQYRDARRDVERVVEGLHERRRRTDRARTPLPAVARVLTATAPVAGPDLRHGRIPAAQPAARRSTSITVHPPGSCSSGRSRPAIRRSPASRTTPPMGARRRRRRPVPAPAPPAVARPPHLSEGPADVRLEGRRRQRRSAAVRRLLPARRRDRVEGPEAGPLGSDLRLGHDVGARRHLRHQDRGVRCAVELAGYVADGELRAPASTSTTRRRASSCSRRRAPARATTRPSSSATISLRCSAWSTRSTRAAGGSSTRRTASRIRAARNSRCAGRERGGRSVIIRATDAMNNVATAVE